MSIIFLRKVYFILACVIIFCGCASKRMPQQHDIFESDSLLQDVFVGFKIIDLESKKVIKEVNASKFFIPASNTKLLTMYTALKTFGDSIPGWTIAEDSQTIYIEPNGDPTFLHDDFANQKLFEKLKNTSKNIYVIIPKANNISRFGAGWSWSFYRENYALERCIMPIYGNLVKFYNTDKYIKAIPSFFTDSISNSSNLDFGSLVRLEGSNQFSFRKGAASKSILSTGFTSATNKNITFDLLKDTLSKVNRNVHIELMRDRPKQLIFKPYYTVSTDTLLAVMMKRSDNFLAEQILIMAGKNRIDAGSDYMAIQHFINNDLSTIIGKGRWADGSGLSRNNLISPNEFIALLEKIESDGLKNRVEKILPSGNQGTLRGLYLGYENSIQAKTGTLSDHLALSGYLKSKSNKSLAFSFLINNHRGNVGEYRKKIQKILTQYIEKI